MKNYHIKAFEFQIKSWKNLAKKSGIQVSQWCRNCLNSVADGSILVDYTEPKMVRGVKSESDDYAVSFQFRVSGWEIDEWKQCADRSGLSIGEWCRQCLDFCVMLSVLRKVS